MPRRYVNSPRRDTERTVSMHPHSSTSSDPMLLCACGCGKSPKTAHTRFCRGHTPRPARHLLVICEVCGRSVERHPSEVSRAARHFCSRSCWGKFVSIHWKGEHGSGWKGDRAGRAAGHARAETLFPLRPCEVCGAKAERHHRDENTLNNDETNITFLCKQHHMEAHWLTPDGRWLNFENRHQRKRARTHCIHGHPYNEANTIILQNGGRDCRACRSVNAKRYREKVSCR